LSRLIYSGRPHPAFGQRCAAPLSRLTLALLLVFALSGLLGAGAPAARAAEKRPSQKLRAVSLVSLQSGLKRAAAEGSGLAELLNLGGLTRVVGYLVDEKTHDLIVFGEADPEAPPLHTEDFVVALRNTRLKPAAARGRRLSYLAPGCSIDPNPQVIRQLNEVGQTIAGSDSAAQMEDAMAEWETACEQPQKVRVMGVPADTHFARVMVEADYYLKRLADGSEALSLPGFTSLTDLEVARSRKEISDGRANHTSSCSFNRFWFHPGPNRYSADGDVAMIVECPVVLLTEEQHLTRTGVAGTGRPDPLAGQFARSFSAHYREIAAARPMYRELEDLFRFVALGGVMKYRQVRVNLDYFLDRFPVSQEEAPETLPGISNVKHVAWRSGGGAGRQAERSYQLWVPSCGGVSMDIKVSGTSFTKPKGNRLQQVKKAALAARPSPKAVSWEFELP
jgi:hypothetical protein